MSGGATDVSVIVPMRDAGPRLPQLLDALSRQTLDSDRFEVVIVDDGSRIPGALPGDEAGSPRARIVVLRLDSPAGAYAARNRAIAEARGEVLAFTDADCRPAPDWLERGLEALSRAEADLVAGRIDAPVGPNPSVAELVDASLHLHQEFFVELGFGATANLFVRRRVLDEIGGFNSSLPRNGDREFCLRASGAGFRLSYAADAIIVHDPRRRARDLVRRAFAAGVGRALTERRGVGPARHRRRNWLKPMDYLPAPLGGRPLLGLERLTAQGYRPSLWERGLMRLAWYVLVGVPLVAGYAFCRATGGRLVSPPDAGSGMGPCSTRAHSLPAR